uniref:Cyclotide n=2 Tax=Clitoria ternatea TaxID=43366 RepID=A0A7G5F3E5_CLITE|nr:cyclotide precursor [Clitoria ternatea]
MTYVRLAPLIVIFLLLPSVKNTEAVDGFCLETCVILPCFSSVAGCYCHGSTCMRGTTIASMAKTIDEHRNLCQTHEDCITKKSGNFCARFPNHNINYGWCFNAESEGFLLKDHLKMLTAN